MAAASTSSSPKAQAALEKLCQTYWYPIYAFVRRQGYTAHLLTEYSIDPFRAIKTEGAGNS